MTGRAPGFFKGNWRAIGLIGDPELNVIKLQALLPSDAVDTSADRIAASAIEREA